jgi:hypothetical protein
MFNFFTEKKPVVEEMTKEQCDAKFLEIFTQLKDGYMSMDDRVVLDQQARKLLDKTSDPAGNTLALNKLIEPVLNTQD